MGTMGQAGSTLHFADFQLGNYWIGRPANVAKQALMKHFPDRLVHAVSLTDITDFARGADPNPERIVVLYDPRNRETIQVLVG